VVGAFLCYTKVVKRFVLYLIRWQLSSPILAVCLICLSGIGTVWATIVANLIGGCIFFFVDKWIFGNKNVDSKRNK